jgi:hypothetical protein
MRQTLADLCCERIVGKRSAGGGIWNFLIWIKAKAIDTIFMGYNM